MGRIMAELGIRNQELGGIVGLEETGVRCTGQRQFRQMNGAWPVRLRRERLAPGGGSSKSQSNDTRTWWPKLALQLKYIRQRAGGFANLGVLGYNMPESTATPAQHQCKRHRN